MLDIIISIITNVYYYL